MVLENILSGLYSDDTRKRIIAIAVKRGITNLDEHVEIAKKYLSERNSIHAKLFAEIALEKGNYEEAIERFSGIGMYKEAADILVQHRGNIQKAIDFLAKETRYQHVACGKDPWERARQSLYYAIELAKQHNLPEKEQEVYEKFASNLINEMGMTHEYDLDSYHCDSGFSFFRNLDDKEIRTKLGRKIIELDSKKTKGYIAGQMCEVLCDKEGAIIHYLDFFKEIIRKKNTTYDEGEKAHNARKRAEKFIEELPEPRKIEFLERIISDYEELGELEQSADMCIKLGRYKQAIKYLESIGCDAQVASLYEKIGKPEKAKEIYENLAKSWLKKKPGDAWAGMAGRNAAIYALDAGNIDLAIKGYLKDERYIDAVKLCLEHGKINRARRIYKKGIIHYEEGLYLELAEELAKMIGDQKRISLYQTISREIGKIEVPALW